MSKQQEALRLALEALEYISSHYMSLPKIGCMALAAVEEALAEQPAQQQEPVAVQMFRTPGCSDWYDGVPDQHEPGQHEVRTLYTAPTPRKPLTDAQIVAVAADIWGNILIAPQSYQAFARAIEAAHGITGEQK